jgi:hypothetical protein
MTVAGLFFVNGVLEASSGTPAPAAPKGRGAPIQVYLCDTDGDLNIGKFKTLFDDAAISARNISKTNGPKMTELCGKGGKGLYMATIQDNHREQVEKAGFKVMGEKGAPAQETASKH